MTQWAYLRGRFIPLEEANVNILTNSFQYGASAFEGIRGNWNEEEKQIYLFRVREHYRRLHDNCRVLMTEIPPVDRLCEITRELIRRSEYKEDVYIRPLAYKSSEMIGTRLHDLDSDFCAAVFPMGPLLASEHCRAGVSSWRRLTGNCGVPAGKISGQYVNGAYAKTEAIKNGFDEAVLLNEAGYVAEACTENIFLVKDGRLLTPAVSENILPGITRASVIEIASNELGMETVERRIERHELYTADECFLTGTAAHVNPVVEIDHRAVGDGEIGPVTKRLQGLYQDIRRGGNKAYSHWCMPV
ncbi:MAG: branched-chain amino acid transaminase [Thermoleophilia bacterium]|nr:branched-chain amino acid transaminase [Thermoleophilia bacterium]